MDPFSLGWLMGMIAGVPAGIMGLLTYQWLEERRRWAKHDELDGYLERLRALHPDSPRWHEPDIPLPVWMTTDAPPDPRYPDL